MDAKTNVAEQVLGELRADQAGAPAEAMNRMWDAVLARSAGRPAHPGGARRARPARHARLLRPVTAGVAAAAAVAVGIGAVAVATGGHPATSGPTSSAAGTPRGGAHPDTAPPATAQQLLGRASLAADRITVAPGDDQFIYSSRRSEVRTIGRPNQRPSVGTGEYWDSVDGSRPGWAVSVDSGHLTSGPTQTNAAPDLGSPTYRFLTTLPTDPDQLLVMIRQSRADLVRQGKIVDLDQDVFEQIGELINLGVLLPPGLGGALYRAAAKIPGVRIVRDAVDAAGRHGLGVYRSSPRGVDPGQSYAMTWIFDPRTFELRGQILDIGTTSDSYALVQVAIVDKARVRPNGQLAPPATPVHTPKLSHRPPHLVGQGGSVQIQGH